MTRDAFPQAVLFDHDGTLVDTEPVWEQGKQELARRYGAHWTDEDTEYALGQPLEVTLRRLSELGVPGGPGEILDLFRDVLREELAERPPRFFPGMMRLLTQLQESGIPAAIVTNSTSEVAEHTASRAPHGVFRSIIGDREVAAGVKPKPDPDAYLAAARELGVDPRACVVIEDSPAGAQAGVAAGIVTVAVPGEQSIPPQPGVVHVPRHADVTLDFLRSLAPEPA